MSKLPTSRELAERVQIDYHRRPRPLRRRLAWLALACILVVAAWVGSAWRRGEHRVFAAGPVSTAHRMIENDCARCHNTWVPLGRLLGMQFRGGGHSIDNAKCLECHETALHHDNQVPGHGDSHPDLSCADCHREHRGQQRLSRVADRQCISCHADLKTREKTPATFARQVTKFDALAHPEFMIQRLLGGEPPPGKAHEVHSVLSAPTADAGGDSAWHDAAHIKFNHSVHLRSERAKNGTENVFLISKDGRTIDRLQSCEKCHTPDKTGRYMQPINYQQHCRECHPLLFDNERKGVEVPHETPELVLGWLTEQYTLQVLRGTADAKPAVVKPDPGTRRPFPGQPFRASLTETQARTVARQVTAAEQHVLQSVHTVFGREAKGGCRYCHDVAEEDSRPNWSIKPPGIPLRWMQHARFGHHAHRFLDCNECHSGVAGSKKTRDVLLPSIANCQKCHVSGSLAGRTDHRVVGARSDCVECHVYHGTSSSARQQRQSAETFIGLPPSKNGSAP